MQRITKNYRRHRSAIPIIALFGSLIATTATAGDLKPGPGFYRVDNPAAEGCLQRAADSVFRLAVFAENPIAKVPAANYDALIEKRDRSHLNQMLATMVKACADKKLPQCPIDYVGDCTASTMQSADLLWTNLHCFETPLEEIRQGEEYLAAKTAIDQHRVLLTSHPRFMLFDAHDQLILDARSGDRKTAWHFLGAADPFQDLFPDDHLSPENSDVAVVRLPAPLKTSVLPTSTTEVAYRDVVSILGYASRTDSRQATYQVPDASGFGIFFSLGDVRDISRAYIANLGNSGFLAGAVEQRERNSGPDRELFFQGDFVGGESGAPILNKQCEVVGIGNMDHCDRTVLGDGYCEAGSSGPSIHWLTRYIAKVTAALAK